MRKGRKLYQLVFAALAAGALALAGCSGDDGDDGSNGVNGVNGVNGANGVNGTNGVNGVNATFIEHEACAACHDAQQPGADDSVAFTHDATDLITITGWTSTTYGNQTYAYTTSAANVVAVATGDNGVAGESNTAITFQFNIALNGTNSAAYDQLLAATREYKYTTTAGTFIDSENLLTGFTTPYTMVSSSGNFTSAAGVNTARFATFRNLYAPTFSGSAGKYQVTIPGGVAAYAGTTSRFIFQLGSTKESATEVPQVGYVVVDYPTARTQLVADAACQACHSTSWTNGPHGGNRTRPMGTRQCNVCHDYRTYWTRQMAPMIHGAHSNAIPDIAAAEEVSYPTYMANCNVCHGASTATVMTAPVDAMFCLTCHADGSSTSPTMAKSNWEFESGLEFHTGLLNTADCKVCHNSYTTTTTDGTTGIIYPAGVAPATVAGFHNGLVTERGGLLYAGDDTSVTKGAEYTQTITGVSISTSGNMSVTWTVTQGTASINPCTSTSPNFVTPYGAYSVLRAYATGDDWVNNGINPTTVGQPISTNLTWGTAGNTQCSGGVNTTTIALSAAEKASTATKRIVALQGKPNYTFTTPDLGAGTTVGSIRIKTPTYQYTVGTSGAVTALTGSNARRSIVNTALCLKCHVGSLYQHGGTRIDNNDLCVMCHNPASSDQITRVLDGTTRTNGTNVNYDGRNGQTYDMKVMLHAQHSSGTTGAIYEVYRSIGIYVWTGENTTIPNWPTKNTSGTTFVNGDPATSYGSVPAGTNTAGTTRVHTEYVVGFPQPLSNCRACHLTGTYGVPDQAKATAVTYDAGTYVVNTDGQWGNQLNDKLMGPAASACMACHQSSNASTQAELRTHAWQMGWVPQVFTGGRTELLNYQVPSLQ